MKTSLASLPAGLSLGLLASVLLSSSVSAGPGPHYWQQMERARADAKKAQVAAPAAKPANTPAMPCANCRTSRVEEFSPTNVSGKIAPHYTTIGSKHACASCGGEVATIRGKTTNRMKDNCPVCAKTRTANAPCCNAAS